MRLQNVKEVKLPNRIQPLDRYLVNVGRNGMWEVSGIIHTLNCSKLMSLEKQKNLKYWMIFFLSLLDMNVPYKMHSREAWQANIIPQQTMLLTIFGDTFLPLHMLLSYAFHLSEFTICYFTTKHINISVTQWL